MLASVLDHAVVTDAAIPCREEPELWFAESPADVELAKSLCHECPVRLECLTGALDRGEPWGVWGGELFVAGTVVPRKRPRGRPRKTDARPLSAAAVGAGRLGTHHALSRARRP